MGTTKDQAELVLEKVQKVAEARIRPMMGEYILYVNEKVIGQINNNQLFIKVTSFGEHFAAGFKKEPPYPGAKPAFIIPQSRIDDRQWLKDFLAGTVEQL